MKYLNKISILLLIFLAASCKKDDIPPIGEAFDKVEGITATNWVIEEVYLVDESNPARPEREISEYYKDGARLELNFNTDGTFEVIPGSGLNFFPESGTWSFDSNNAPTKIVFTDQNMVETVAPLGGPTRISDPQLKINFTKKSCDDSGELKAVLGYRLVFNRKS